MCLGLSPVANSDYYKLLMQNGQDERRNATVCTLEELERVTSEHTLKNTVCTSNLDAQVTGSDVIVPFFNASLKMS